MSGAVDRQLLKNATDDMDIGAVVSELDLDGLPKTDEMSLIRQRGSLTVTIFSDAWRSAGRSLEDPGEVQEYWFEEEDLIIIDLNND